jgi:hypothetical protein
MVAIPIQRSKNRGKILFWSNLGCTKNKPGLVLMSREALAVVGVDNCACQACQAAFSICATFAKSRNCARTARWLCREQFFWACYWAVADWEYTCSRVSNCRECFQRQIQMSSWIAGPVLLLWWVRLEDREVRMWIDQCYLKITPWRFGSIFIFLVLCVSLKLKNMYLNT